VILKIGEFFSQTIAKLVEFIVKKNFQKFPIQKLHNFFHPENDQNFPQRKHLVCLLLISFQLL
jgi:hypothetical protein